MSSGDDSFRIIVVSKSTRAFRFLKERDCNLQKRRQGGNITGNHSEADSLTQWPQLFRDCWSDCAGLPSWVCMSTGLGRDCLKLICVVCTLLSVTRNSGRKAKHVSTFHVCAVAQLCLILCNPMNCSSPGSSVQGILQAKILAWVAIFSSRGSS